MVGSEHSVRSGIQVELSKHHCIVFRANVGKVRTPDGRFSSAGLPSGYPDLGGFRWIDGKIFFIEVKDAAGKPREDQIRFRHMPMSHGIIHGIARSVDGARMVVERGLCGYGFDD